MEALRGEDALEALDKARGEWEGLVNPSTGTESDAGCRALHARFEEACQRATERHANRQSIEQTHARLDALSQEAERIASSRAAFDEDAWKQLAAEWASLVGKADGLDARITQRFEDARAKRRTARGRASGRRRAPLRQQVQRIEQLDRAGASARAAAEDLTLREADRMARDLRAAIERRAPRRATRERQSLVERLKAALGARGAAAAGSPRDGRVEALRQRGGPGGADRADGGAAHEIPLRRRGRPLARRHREGGARAPRDPGTLEAGRRGAARAGAGALASLPPGRRPDSGAAARVLRRRIRRAQEQPRAKLALIERAEALADSTDWIKTADELKKLQHEWQQIGAVPAQRTRATWKRFRDACDKFFTRRNADLAERKETWSANLAKKEALCARAEELAGLARVGRAAAEIRRLQTEWKTVGPVRRNKSEAIWQRFRTACDTFFDRYKRRDEIELEAKQADREALVAELESLAQPVCRGADDTRADAPPICSNACARCARAGTRRRRSSVRAPIRSANASSDALERVMLTHPEQFRGTELDVDASRQKMEKLSRRSKASCPRRRRRRATRRRRSPTCCARRSPRTRSAAAAATRRAGARWARTCARRRRRGAGSDRCPARPAAS